MIEQEQIMERLLTACPSYRKRYERYIEQHYEAGEKRLIYVDIGDFVEYAIERYRSGKTGEFEDLFETIEQLLTSGDAEVQEFATVGILETFQNKSPDRNVEYGEWERWLHPESERRWNRLIEDWNGKTAST
ncbi:hypothetical protein CDO73_01600 [Saccharibacillus sp. O23]|uniref:DUF7674 family protein n=1 Tax=Saccharibacillus sp. O23 TaxID=2009338 RepID=UPI000B4DF38B|nr:hypothetical protein [Saccharibacillus sp. O23]OWR32329.1 hypothetical protein CDO73_01600 [Saccharibacillus sp. O23]